MGTELPLNQKRQHTCPIVLAISQNNLRFWGITHFRHRNFSALPSGRSQDLIFQIGIFGCFQTARRAKMQIVAVTLPGKKPQRIDAAAPVSVFHFFAAHQIADNAFRAVNDPPLPQKAFHLPVRVRRVSQMSMPNFRIRIDKKDNFTAPHHILVHRIPENGRHLSRVDNQQNVDTTGNITAGGRYFRYLIILFQQSLQRRYPVAVQQRHLRRNPTDNRLIAFKPAQNPVNILLQNIPPFRTQCRDNGVFPGRISYLQTEIIVLVTAVQRQNSVLQRLFFHF